MVGMGIDSVIGLSVSLAVGAILKLLSEYFKNRATLRMGRSSDGNEPAEFGEQMDKLVAEFRRSSQAVDLIVAEMSAVASRRAEAIRNLETELADKHKRRQELEQRISDLQGLTLPAVEQLESFLRLKAAGVLLATTSYLRPEWCVVYWSQLR
jgi:hypothetical protein